MRRHLAAATFFSGLAVLWSYPLAARLTTHMPGALGDNEQFLWDFWWMRRALATGADFFYSPYLLAPLGADLTLHTHTALAALVGATIFGRLSVVSAMNVTTIISLSLNGFCGYLLAWRMTRDRGAALLAGIIFGTSPYVAAHLNGHYDLIMPWTIALFAYVIPDAIGGRLRSALLAGLVLGLTAYVSAYYVVYDSVIALCVLAPSAREWTFRRRDRPYPRWLTRAVALAIVVDAGVIATIVATGGLIAQIGPLRLSMRDTFNALEILWVLIAIALWIRVRPAVVSRPRAQWSFLASARAAGIVVGTFLVIAAPLVWKGLRLWINDEYVTQTYFWRSAPVGVDLATLFLGNPFHGLWGGAVRRLYDAAGINVIESVGWLGVVPLALAAYAVLQRNRGPLVTRWTVIGAVFLIWALGSLVHVAGQNVALIGPAFVLRYVPFVENARMPGRAMVVVYLAIAMLAAAGASHLRTRFKRPAMAMVLFAALALGDAFVAPFPLAEVDCPPIYQALRERPESGTLAELPLGIGDGFGPVTPIDPWALPCQIVHERPMLGGVVSRLPARLIPSYRADPLIGAWLRLSGAPDTGGAPVELPDRELSLERLKANNIAFLILHRAAASPELRDHVERVLPLTRVIEDGDRVLYVTTP